MVFRRVAGSQGTLVGLLYGEVPQGLAHVRRALHRPDERKTLRRPAGIPHPRQHLLDRTPIPAQLLLFEPWGEQATERSVAPGGRSRGADCRSKCCRPDLELLERTLCPPQVVARRPQLLVK